MGGRLTQTPTTCKSFFAIEIIGLASFHDDFFMPICSDGPLAAVGIITGITSCAAAARIISDHVVNKILVATIAELMRFPRLKKEGVARSNLSYSVFVANAAPA